MPSHDPTMPVHLPLGSTNRALTTVVVAFWMAHCSKTLHTSYKLVTFVFLFTGMVSFVIVVIVLHIVLLLLFVIAVSVGVVAAVVFTVVTVIPVVVTFLYDLCSQECQ